MKIFKLAGATAGVAAAALLIIAIVLMNRTVPAASAAEALRQATAATRGYAGWIHVESATDYVRPNGAVPYDGGSFHVNTENDTVASVSSILGHKKAQYFSPAEGQYLRYDGDTNTITRDVSDGGEARATADYARRDFMPDTLIERLSEYAQLTVTRSNEGEMERFDVRIEPPADPRFILPKEVVVLVRPDTRLVEEIRTLSREFGDTVTMRFTYGEPAIRDIYDLGVPRDAAIVDALTSRQ